MKKLVKISLLTLTGVLASIGLAACGSSATATPTPTTSAGQPTATPTPTASFDAAAYFQGKTITLVVPYGAGGGTDIIARATAQQWQNFIPGHPKIEVQNKTPEVAGLNTVWHAKPDGFTIGTMSASGWYNEAFQTGADYNAQGWTVLGAVSKADFAILTRQDVPYATLADAEGGTYPLKQGVAATDPSQVSGNDISLMWLADTLNLPLQVYGITNYNSSSVALVSFEAGEVNILTRNGGGGWAGLPTTRPGWEKDGFVKQLVSMTNPNTQPTTSPEGGPWTAKNVVDYLTPDQQKTWLGMMSYPSFDKPYVLPPGVPDNIAQVLINSFWETMQDSTSAAAIQKAMGGIPFDPVDGNTATAETKANAQNYADTFPKVATTAQVQAWLDKYAK